jgi:hypothetical protein
MVSPVLSNASRTAFVAATGSDRFDETAIHPPRQPPRHGLVAQLTELGMYRDEFEVGYDWFHQGESLLSFYFLTMADPATWSGRAVRDPARGARSDNSTDRVARS